MRGLLTELMDSARARAGYADARFVRSRVERLSTRNGRLDQLDSRESEGIGIRVRVRGRVGLRGGARHRPRRRRGGAGARARRRRGAAGGAGRRAARRRSRPPAASGRAGFERDPFEVPLEEKLSVLLAADAGLRTEPGVKLTRARFSAFGTDTVFANTEGALFEQHVIECGGGIAATAVDGGESQIRSYPASHGGHVAQAGYEHFLELELPGHAPRVAAEAVRAAERAGLPARPHDPAAGRRAARAPGARVGGPRGGARPRARAARPRTPARASCRRTASGRSASAPSA